MTDSLSTVRTAPCGPTRSYTFGCTTTVEVELVRRVPTVSQNGSMRSMASGPTSNTPRRIVGMEPSATVAVLGSTDPIETRVSWSSHRSMIVARPDRNRVVLCSR